MVFLIHTNISVNLTSLMYMTTCSGPINLYRDKIYIIRVSPK